MSARGRSADPRSLGHGQGSAAASAGRFGRGEPGRDPDPPAQPVGPVPPAGPAQGNARHGPGHQRWGRHQRAHPGDRDWLGRDPTSPRHPKTWTLLSGRAHPCQPGWAHALPSSAKALSGRRDGMKLDTAMMTGGLSEPGALPAEAPGLRACSGLSTAWGHGPGPALPGRSCRSRGSHAGRASAGQAGTSPVQAPRGRDGHVPREPSTSRDSLPAAQAWSPAGDKHSPPCQEATARYL